MHFVLSFRPPSRPSALRLRLEENPGFYILDPDVHRGGKTGVMQEFKYTATTMNNTRVYNMPFASVYPLYVAKAKKKGRTQAEVDVVTRWLTGYTQKKLEAQIKKQVSFETFFAQAPKMNPNRRLITGVICGIRVENITEPLMQEIRYLDKLIDELAKGRPLEKILRAK